MIREHATVSHCEIAGAKVHIWQMTFTDLDEAAADGIISADWLAPDEVTRAQRYIDAQVRQLLVEPRIDRNAFRGALLAAQALDLAGVVDPVKAVCGGQVAKLGQHLARDHLDGIVGEKEVRRYGLQPEKSAMGMDSTDGALHDGIQKGV